MLVMTDHSTGDKPTKPTRLQADSNAVVQRAFYHAVIDLEGEIRHRGRKLRPGPMLNALAYWFSMLEEAERLRIGREAMSLYETVPPENGGGKLNAAEMELLRRQDGGPEPEPRKRGRKKSG